MQNTQAFDLRNINTTIFNPFYHENEKKHYVLIGILILLIITNPSEKASKDYLGPDSYRGLKRPFNFFICSYYVRDHDGKYFAVFGSFITINEDEGEFTILQK